MTHQISLLILAICGVVIPLGFAITEVARDYSKTMDGVRWSHPLRWFFRVDMMVVACIGAHLLFTLPNPWMLVPLCICSGAVFAPAHRFLLNRWRQKTWYYLSDFDSLYDGIYLWVAARLEPETIDKGRSVAPTSTASAAMSLNRIALRAGLLAYITELTVAVLCAVWYITLI